MKCNSTLSAVSVVMTNSRSASAQVGVLFDGGALSNDEAMKKPPKRSERKTRSAEVKEEDAPRLVGRERAQLPEAAQLWDLLGGYAEFVRGVVECRFFEVVGADRPVEIVGQEFQHVAERSDLAQALRGERHSSAFVELEPANESRLRRVDRCGDLLQVRVADVLAHLVASGDEFGAVDRGDAAGCGLGSNELGDR